MAYRMSDPLPASLGAWDRMVSNARAQNQINADAESELCAHRDHLKDILTKAVKVGDANAPVYHVKPWKEGKKVPTLAELLFSAILERADLQASVIQLLLDAQAGKDVRLMAQLYLSTVLECVADEEARAE